MSRLTRRDFLRDAALLATASAALAGDSYAQPWEEPILKKVGPNDKIRVAVIGFNGQGLSHIKAYAAMPETEVAVVCDCDANLADRGIKAAADIQKTAPKFEQDLRRVMEDRSIDVVTIATPNHWHALAAIWAVQNGKDVYVEKPVSHNVFEGRRLVEIAREHQRIVQTGTQSRSNAGMRQAIEYLHAGHLGQIKLAKGLCYKFRPSIGPRVTGEVPKTVHYDLWCGPAPLLPPQRTRFHYDWHWFWDYGNGDLGNQGIHEMDKARWGLKLDRLCDRVFSFGGRLGYTDAGETANTQVSCFDYGDVQIIFEVRGLATADPMGKNRGKNFVGNIWYGTEGTMVSSSYDAAVVLDPQDKVVKQFKGGGQHHANFIKAVKSRKVEDLNADVEQGHISSALCHLANISYRMGTLHPFESLSMLNQRSSLAPEIERLRVHLEDNKIAINSDLRLQVGMDLAFDPAKEQFTGYRQANAWLTREYRKGFEVPGHSA